MAKNYREAIELAYQGSPALCNRNDVVEMFKRAGIEELFQKLEDAEHNYCGAMIDLDHLVAAYRKRMPDDEFLNLNYPLEKKDV